MIEEIMFYDNLVLDFIQTMRTPVLDKIMVYLTLLGDKGVLWIICALVMLALKKYRKIGIALVISLFFCFFIGNIWLKPLIARPRPFETNNFINLLITAPKDFSFPSGHTMASFAGSFTILSFDKKIGIVFLLLAIFISFSRLYLYVHYFTDILGGIVIGIIIGKIAVKITKKFYC